MYKISINPEGTQIHMHPLVIHFVQTVASWLASRQVTV